MTQFSAKPRLSKAQIVTNNVYRKPERLGRFLRCHSAEIPHFNEPRYLLVFYGERIESVV
jgi:hypothetical protein